MQSSAGSVGPLVLLILCTVGPGVLGDYLTGVKKGSCASSDRSICIYAKPLPDACQNDSQCPGTQRCCCSNCRRVCTETVKAGTCPRALAKCKLPLPEPECRSDADCQDRKKCCSMCGSKCMDPETGAERPGVCPVDPEIEKQCGYLPPPRCRSDAECLSGEKCCLFGCGVQCVKALPEKSGVCPAVRITCMIFPLPRSCNSDANCGGIQKCCQNSCGFGCIDPMSTDHTGFCPAYKPVQCDASYTSDCGDDSGCKADEKCCNVGCRHMCVRSLKEKPGACPFIPMGELSEDMCNRCNEDKGCPGNEKCCSGGKGRECRKPNQEIVKSGECPRRISWCDRPPPYDHTCNNDSDCTGAKKCCIEVCTQECKDPVPVKPKTGMCPIDNIRCKKAEDDQCKNDGGCNGDEKCCHFRCGLKCKAPRTEKPGECPVPVTICAFQSPPSSPPKCDQDSDCPGSQKCCTPECTQECTNITTVKPKPGMCPIDNIRCMVAEDDQCKNDGDCDGDEKCCQFHCGLKCKAPETVHAGSCPSLPPGRIGIVCTPELKKDTCQDDSSCSATEKCCPRICHKECVESVTVKTGACPKDTVVCIQAEPDQCKNDSDCTGNQKCCYFQCGRKCKNPATVHAGSCPSLPPGRIGIVCTPELKKDTCQDDSSCSATEKCCPQICHKGCVESMTVKTGACPKDTVVCIQAEPDQCKNDSDCTGNQKCCYFQCGLKCKNPATVKTGACPKDTVVCKRAEPDQCKNDSDCTGNQKCCDFQCGLKCKDPATEKPGECPMPITRCAFPPPPSECNQDSDCSGSQKCCTPVCTKKCTNITTDLEKPGSCPLPPSYPTCDTFPSPPMNACATDQQCLGDEKCCDYGCKLQCKMPLQDKLGSCPAFNRSICLYARPAPAECSSDSQCPGTQRCCCHGACRMECAETVKPGTCPPEPGNCPLPLPAQKCEADSDCEGKRKCCSQCGIQCTDPTTGNPGFCPVDPANEKQCGYLPPARCSSDADCKAHEKCCLFGCGVQCVKALPVKPGMCPAILAKCMLPLAKPACHDDGDCPENRKCCQLCGNKCLESVPDHAGVCPSYNIPKPLICPAIYNPSCNHDWNCNADEKCCNVGCQRQCVKALKEKMGVCPRVPFVTESKNSCNRCNNDKDCPGNDRCCAGPKGRECQPPSKFVGLPIPKDPPGSKS